MWSSRAKSRPRPGGSSVPDASSSLPPQALGDQGPAAAIRAGPRRPQAEARSAFARIRTAARMSSADAAAGRRQRGLGVPPGSPGQPAGPCADFDDGGSRRAGRARRLPALPGRPADPRCPDGGGYPAALAASTGAVAGRRATGTLDRSSTSRADPAEPRRPTMRGHLGGG